MKPMSLPSSIVSSTMMLLSFATLANNIQVSNATLTANNGTHVIVQFDLSWENSWRGGGLPNWDAAWVFVKYRGVDHVWHHAYLWNTGHLVTTGPGAVITTGLLDPALAFNFATNPVVGAFIHRGVPGSGTFSLTGVQLNWYYEGQGLTFSDIEDIGVFAIEMVSIPGGSFLAGHQNPGPATITPFDLTEITTADASVEASGAAGTMGAAQGGAPATTNLVAGWPNGFKAFYCMKYEVSEQGFVDFLNTLTYNQQLAHGQGQPPMYSYPSGSPGSAIWTQYPSVGGITPAIMAVNGDGDANFNEPEDGGDLACGNLAGLDLLAYLDWCGLRPMTELEFEKTCRGQALPLQAPEYAWGTTTIATSTHTLTALGTPNEAITTNYSTTYGNAHYSSTSAFGRAYRCGVFAAHPSSTGRVTAGASYYGVMEMNGNLRERVVKGWGSAGPSYSGKHGNGELSSTGFPNVPDWPLVNTDAAISGSGFRGGGFADPALRLRITDRESTQFSSFDGDERVMQYGGRGVRTIE